MKAIVRESYGGPEVLNLKEIEKPFPKKNEVLVKIYAASLTKAETIMRTGKPYLGRLVTGLFKPKSNVMGFGFSGVIEAIGSEVKQFHKYDQVFGEVDMKTGTNAEYVCVAENAMIAIKPEYISFEDAAPICDGVLTSMNFLTEVIKIKKGQKVLINGAAGSLGTAAIQLAKYYGAEVTGVCSSSSIDFVKSLGADHVTDYTKEDFTQVDFNNGNTFDIIYDTIGSSSFFKCKKTLSEKGVYMTPVLKFSTLVHLSLTALICSKKVKFSATGLLPVPKLQKMTKNLMEIYQEGKLKTVVTKAYTMEQISEAHSYIDSGHKKGNFVLNVRTTNDTNTNVPYINISHMVR